MSVAPMGTRRKHLGVAVYMNMIYAVGGRDDATELSSAERFHPQTNTWQPVVAMTSRRSGVTIGFCLLLAFVISFLFLLFYALDVLKTCFQCSIITQS